MDKQGMWVQRMSIYVFTCLRIFHDFLNKTTLQQLVWDVPPRQQKQWFFTLFPATYIIAFVNKAYQQAFWKFSSSYSYFLFWDPKKTNKTIGWSPFFCNVLGLASSKIYGLHLPSLQLDLGSLTGRSSSSIGLSTPRISGSCQKILYLQVVPNIQEIYW